MEKFGRTDKFAIGLVCCRVGKIKGNSFHEQTFTLIKSLLISCKFNNISEIEIHLFLEHTKDADYFRKEIEEKLLIFSQKMIHPKV